MTPAPATATTTAYNGIGEEAVGAGKGRGQEGSRPATRQQLAKMASFKIFSLVVKALSKPVANRIKAAAAEGLTMRAFCEHSGRIAYRFSVRLNAQVMGTKVTEITPLSEKKAVKQGAEVLSETLLIGVAGLLVLWEYDRKERDSVKSKAKAKALHAAEQDAWERRFKTVDAEVEAIMESRDELMRELRDLRIEVSALKAKVGDNAPPQKSWLMTFIGR